MQVRYFSNYASILQILCPNSLSLGRWKLSDVIGTTSISSKKIILFNIPKLGDVSIINIIYAILQAKRSDNAESSWCPEYPLILPPVALANPLISKSSKTTTSNPPDNSEFSRTVRAKHKSISPEPSIFVSWRHSSPLCARNKLSS
jgi:hypothetical protein